MKHYKIQKQKNGQLTLTLPSSLAAGFGWQKGDRLEFKIVGAGVLQIKKKDQNV